MSRTPSGGVSVVVATNRRRDKLDRCLRSLVEHIREEIEIILVDNDPAQSAREIASRFSAVRYVSPPQPLGVAAVRNLGVNLSKFPWVLIIDDDAFIQSNVCAEAIRLFAEDPLAASVALRIVDVPTGRVYGRCDPCKVCPGGGGMFRKSAYYEIGPQREEFRFGAEEIDWAVRCYNSGHRIRYAENATVFHDPDHRTATGEFIPEYKLINGLRNRLLFLFYNFRYRTVLAQGVRVCLSSLKASLERRTLRPLCFGLLEAARAGRRTRAQRKVVRRDVEDFYTRPNSTEEEFSISYWHKLLTLPARKWSQRGSNH